MAAKEIITGQYVRIQQTPASLGDRFFARLIDLVAIFIYLVSITIFLAQTFTMFSDASQTVVLTVFLLFYGPAFGYAFLCEYFFEGQTLGKAIMSTRVVMADGSSPTIGALFLRWLLESVDIFMSGVGLLFIAVTGRHQRIGDLAAGTLVIKQPRLDAMTLSLNEFQYASADHQPVYPEAQNLSVGQAGVIEKVLYGAVMYDDNKVRKLATKVRTFLDVQPKTENPTQFLVDVLHDYQYYALQIV